MGKRKSTNGQKTIEGQGRNQTFEDVVFVVERWNSVGINHEINLIIASHRFGYICRDFDSNLVY
jgi:hypothetical protein